MGDGTKIRNVNVTHSILHKVMYFYFL